MRYVILIVAVVGCVISAAASADIRLGLLNDFETGVTQGWGNNIASGQPEASGALDCSAFMRIASTGPQGNNPQCPGGANNAPRECGSNLAINNLTSDWTGDYLRSLVQGIRLDVRNAGPNEAALRMAFAKIHSSSSIWWITATPVILPANGDWQTVTFSLAEEDLMKSIGFGIDGSNIYDQAFASIAVARILVNPEVSHKGEKVMHTIDVDNITALTNVSQRSAGGGAQAIFSSSFEMQRCP